MLETPEETRAHLAERAASAAERLQPGRAAARGGSDRLTMLAIAYAAAAAVATPIGAEAVVRAPAASQLAQIDAELRARRQVRTFGRGARIHW